MRFVGKSRVSERPQEKTKFGIPSFLPSLEGRMEHPCESDHRQKEERGRGRRAGKFTLSSGGEEVTRRKRRRIEEEEREPDKNTFLFLTGKYCLNFFVT